MNKHIKSIIFYTLLIAFTTYVALDTFVLERKMVENATDINTSMFSDNIEENNIEDEASTENVKPEESTEIEDEVEKDLIQSPYNPINTDYTPYSDENVSISIAEYFEYNTHIYVADVTVRSSVYINTAFAKDTYGKNVVEKTSDIASENNAIFAVNGDYYGAREKGYVIRNGIAYRDKSDESDLLCLYADGSMKIITQGEYAIEELIDEGVWQAWSFGPALLENGEISVDEHSEVGQHMASNPRTAVGMVDNNHFIFVVSDGRTNESSGLSLLELADFMKQLGVTTAYNLDGGGSSTMYYDGAIINKPTTNGKIKERRVSDIVYIKKQENN